MLGVWWYSGNESWGVAKWTNYDSCMDAVQSSRRRRHGAAYLAAEHLVASAADVLTSRNDIDIVSWWRCEVKRDVPTSSRQHDAYSYTNVRCAEATVICRALKWTTKCSILLAQVDELFIAVQNAVCVCVCGCVCLGVNQGMEQIVIAAHRDLHRRMY